MSGRQAWRRSLAVCALVVLSASPAAAKPEWAKPFLDQPTPSGGYIAKNDAWVVVEGQIELALTDKGLIESRYRFLLQNMHDRPELFTTILPCDESSSELKDLALNVQRILWHKIDLTRAAAKISVKNINRVTVASVEDIEPKKRVSLEYTIVDKLGFLPWVLLSVPRAEPVARLRVSVEPASAQRGLVVELVRPAGEPLPASFARQEDGSWTVTDIPAEWRIGTPDLYYQPDSYGLFPYFLARASADPHETVAAFVQHYRSKWNERLAAVDSAQVKARAESLTQGAATPGEKAARLAGFVQSEIQYDDSNSSSLDAWIPLETQESLRSMKADCKGKVLLLQALLKSVDIVSSPVLLHAGREYFAWGDNVGSAILNHVILAVAIPGEAPWPGALTEGPGKGMVLFDATDPTVPFGQPPAGFEGVSALFVGDTQDPRFVIHTASPALASARVEVEMTLGKDGEAIVRLTGTDYGVSKLAYALLYGVPPAQHKDYIRRAFSERLPKAVVVKESEEKMTVVPPVPERVEIEMIEPQCVQELGSRSLLPNPMGLGAVYAGLPASLRPSPPGRPDDAVSLAAPWDWKLNVQGLPSVLDIKARLVLPPNLKWEPPPPMAEDRPWVKIAQKWTVAADGAHEGTLHIEQPRGSWPKEERRARLTLMDTFYTSLASPLVLTSTRQP